MLQEGSFSESTPDVVANRFWVVRLCVQTSPNSNYLNPEPSSRIQEKCTTVTWGARSIALAITQERNLQRKVDPGPSTPVFVLSILCPSRSLSLSLSLSLALASSRSFQHRTMATSHQTPNSNRAECRVPTGPSGYPSVVPVDYKIGFRGL